jgi:hypothetical protein
MHVLQTALVFVGFQESVGPDDIPGYDKVEALAEFFVNIPDFGALANSQVDQVEEFWEAMMEYNKRPTVA